MSMLPQDGTIRPLVSPSHNGRGQPLSIPTPLFKGQGQSQPPHSQPSSVHPEKPSQETYRDSWPSKGNPYRCLGDPYKSARTVSQLQGRAACAASTPWALKRPSVRLLLDSPHQGPLFKRGRSLTAEVGQRRWGPASSLRLVRCRIGQRRTWVLLCPLLHRWINV